MSTRRPTTTRVPQGEPPARPPASDPATRARIEARAYDLYLARKGGPGDAVSDWLRAERELRRQTAPGEDAGANHERARGEELLSNPED